MVKRSGEIILKRRGNCHRVFEYMGHSARPKSLKLALNWVCFGFVFSASEEMEIAVMLCQIKGYVHLVI